MDLRGAEEQIKFDDILNDFQNNSSIRRPQKIDDEQRANDLEALTQAWINEKSVPDILPYEEELLDRILDRVRAQIEFIELNSIELQKHERDIKLLLVIVESELERVQFLIRSYVRLRLMKIDKFALHILHNESEQVKLSGNEIVYMEKHLEMINELFDQQFMKKLPDRLKNLDDEEMIDGPDLDRPVFFKSMKQQKIIFGNYEVDLNPGDVHVLRYSAIAKSERAGDVVII